MTDILDRLYRLVASRKGGDPETSYTAKLFSQGRGKIGQKFGEEAVETLVAALSESNEQVILESADLLYHLMVLWADKGVEPGQVWTELENRFGSSGLEEKRARSKP